MSISYAEIFRDKKARFPENLLSETSVLVDTVWNCHTESSQHDGNKSASFVNDLAPEKWKKLRSTYAPVLEPQMLSK